MKLIVSMGIRPDSNSPLRARLVEIDVDQRRVCRSLTLPFHAEWHSGPRADDEATRPAWIDGALIQPTHTAVHRVDVERWVVSETHSSPDLHNIHSVWPDGDRWLLTAAGRDAVVWLDRQGHTEVRALAAARERVESRSVDHRILHHGHYKPHVYHPNCAWTHEGQIWVTCFERRAALEVGGVRQIAFDQIPHDGSPQEGLWWFTLVDGRVVAHDPTTLERVHLLDLRAMLGAPGLLGWCRGVHVAGDRLFVGFTQLRATRHRRVLRWLASAGRDRQLPTRVVEVDLRRGCLVGEIAIAPGGTIYGISPARAPSG